MPEIPTIPPDFSRADDGPTLHVVLVEPEIPQNTGSIARLCAATGSWLHLVEPLGYELDDRHLRRAGLDYWPDVRVSRHESTAAAEARLPRERTWLFSKRAPRTLWEVEFARGDVLVFGREADGLDPSVLARWEDRVVRIPVSAGVRSLNVANAVAIAQFEALRQLGWKGDSPREGVRPGKWGPRGG